MSKKITKNIAQKVAIKIAADSYNDKVEKVRKKIRAYTDKLVEEYIPQPVLEVTKEYKEFFVVSKMLGVKCENGRLCITETNYVLPTGRTIIVKPDQYEKLKSLNNEKMAVCVQRDNFCDRIIDVLRNLKTEKRIREQMPEVIPYLALFLDVTDEAPKTSDYIKSIREGIKTPKKNG